MKTLKTPIALTTLVLLAACHDEQPPEPLHLGAGQTQLVVDLESDGANWAKGFADVTDAQKGAVDFDAGVRDLPLPLAGRALHHSGLNVSSDLFMFFTREIDGLEPNADYSVMLELEFVTDVHEGCTGGIADGVSIKAGLAPVAPRADAVMENGVAVKRMTIDVGADHTTGSVGVAVLDDIRNGLVGCPPVGVYDAERTSGPDAVTVTADERGHAWIIIATDSGVASAHEMYFTELELQFSPIP
jgi:hypothetical protein